MKINGIGPIQAYGMSNVQQEAYAARSVQDADVQLRIAENSEQRLVLLNLALNDNLDKKTIRALFARKLPYLTNRLNNLGYKDSWF